MLVPAATPVTVPLAEPTVALAGVPLVHVPVPVASLRVTRLLPGHIAPVLPVTGVIAFTVKL